MTALPPRCLFCDELLEITFVDLGSTPLANSYVQPSSSQAVDPVYPLHARVCSNCFLVQVDPVVPPEEIFSDYAYFSSVSESWVEHARGFAAHAVERLDLTSESLVVEVASNDGYLLRHFRDLGVPILGVEPAVNVAAEAEAVGVPTLVSFFGADVAKDITSSRGSADLICVNNVLAHVPDPNDFVAGLAHLISPSGTITVEAPHLLRLIRGVQFDTIYHEHYSYLSLLTVEKVFGAHGLVVYDVDELPTHGGSLRYWAAPLTARRSARPGLLAVRASENAAGLHRVGTYRDFSARVAKCRTSLLGFLGEAAAANRSVAGYGAAAKGNTLLNFCGLTGNDIPFVVDRSPHKQGLLLPGSRIPIVATEELRLRQPDHVLVLAWNLLDEIRAQTAFIADWGATLVVPIPTVAVVR
ncbi:MAG: class I SAM-dependent methyltransferase [Gemmatimonadales bacterium]